MTRLFQVRLQALMHKLGVGGWGGVVYINEATKNKNMVYLSSNQMVQKSFNICICDPLF